MTGGSILERWDVTPDQLTRVLDDNPSVKGMLMGYMGEVKLDDLWLKPEDRVTAIYSPDDHDRGEKADRVITYQDHEFLVEVKSLQSNTIRKENGTWVAKSQVDASDSRTIQLPNGTEITTTCLLAGQFDLLAVNLFSFEDEWRFVFAKNSDLPRTNYHAYSEYQQQHLLATTVQVTWPPSPPFRDEPFSLLDEMVEERNQ